MKSFKRGASRLGHQACMALAAAALSVLAACGGGTEQIDPFRPTRIVTFGDESSLINPDGKKYTINGVDSVTLQQSCSINPIWVQTLAASFGLTYAQCNPSNLATPPGLMFATAGAQVADVAAKVDQFFAGNSFNSKDLVTVFVGTNDLLELYNQFPAQSKDALITNAKARGEAVAVLVNRIASAGGRVIVSTLPDLGVLPFAVKEKATKFDTDRAALLSSLSNAFNVAMRLKLTNDGRLIGLLLLDESIQADVRYPSSFGLANVTEPACLTTIGITNCTAQTLTVGATADTWLWASDTLMGPAGHAHLASLAVTRANNNPF